MDSNISSIRPFLLKYGCDDFLRSVVNCYTFCVFRYDLKFKCESFIYQKEEQIFSKESDHPNFYKSFLYQLTIEKQEDLSDSIYIVNYNNQLLFFSEDLFKEYQNLIPLLSKN